VRVAAATPPPQLHLTPGSPAGTPPQPPNQQQQQRTHSILSARRSTVQIRSRQDVGTRTGHLLDRRELFLWSIGLGGGLWTTSSKHHREINSSNSNNNNNSSNSSNQQTLFECTNRQLAYDNLELGSQID
jgi:hypothetical protein